LTIAFVGLAVGPLLLVGGIIAWQAFLVQRRQALDIQREVAQRVATQVTAFFKGMESDLRLVSRLQGLRTLERDERLNIMHELLSHQDAIGKLILLDHEGREQAYLSHTKAIPPELHSRAESDEFIIPSTREEPYYGPVRFDEMTGEPLMTIAVPHVNVYTGRVDGVLVAEAHLKKIWGLISSIQLGPGQSVYIVDTEGKVVAHRNPSLVLRGTRFDKPEQDGIQFGLTGSRVVLAVETIQLGQQELNIVTEQTASEALALAVNTIAITVALILAALGISNTLGILIVRQIVHPIQTMASTAQAISAGDLSRQVEIASRDELGVLANAFNSMTTQLRLLINSLERRVTERTAQLEASNKELEAFTYSVSHDLRAPLRHIVGFIQLLQRREEGQLDETSLRYLNTIAESADRMGLLIDDLLAFSRTGRIEMQSRRVELGKLVRQVQQELLADVEDRRVTWQIDPLPSVQGDPVLLRQVWTNLLSNAIKFTAPRPEARIEIGALPSESESDTATLFIRDNGVGFDPRYAHKLFGVFQRLHQKEEFDGTGIGLATVKRIVERHGGKVWAESELGHGATFYMTLERAQGTL
jgi:signal transduction histidine kinase